MSNSDGVNIPVALQSRKDALKQYYSLVSKGNDALASGQYDVFLECEKKRRDIKRKLKL